MTCPVCGDQIGEFGYRCGIDEKDFACSPMCAQVIEQMAEDWIRDCPPGPEHDLF